MPTPNPVIKQQIEELRRKLAEVKAEKARLFPPNPHPFAQPDTFPKNATPQQIAKRNELNAQIESLENRIEELQNRLYLK